MVRFAITISKCGSLPYIIKMLRGIPRLKHKANLNLHGLDNLKVRGPFVQTLCFENGRHLTCKYI